MTVPFWVAAALLAWFVLIVGVLAWFRAAKTAGEDYDRTLHNYRDPGEEVDR